MTYSLENDFNNSEFKKILKIVNSLDYLLKGSARGR